ncbi:LytR/AlgR family response regulator transcription factor [Tenacibaculum sp. MEBiC06402]|uniref:LytR/AlgR family response regulator transcription factor n=1 Tax=unclassified Tenacibaculum TaxID=2635139 RepID=UPI003B9BC4F6
MKVVIVEDEVLAVEKLERYLMKYSNKIEVVEKLDSIHDSVNYFTNNQNFDLVFMDIQLTDGLSFEIFKQVTINKPIIFITAFDEFAIDAFKVNSIDYILKPITFTDISNAISKFESMQKLFKSNEVLTKVGEELVQRKAKDRFLVRLGNHIHSIKTNDIALFYAEGRTVQLITNEGKKFIVDFKLEDLIKLLVPSVFYRVNRSFIININAIKDVVVYSNSRLKISSTITVDKDIIVSREKVSAFKNWFEGN